MPQRIDDNLRLVLGGYEMPDSDWATIQPLVKKAVAKFKYVFFWFLFCMPDTDSSTIGVLRHLSSVFWPEFAYINVSFSMGTLHWGLFWITVVGISAFLTTPRVKVYDAPHFLYSYVAIGAGLGGLLQLWSGTFIATAQMHASDTPLMALLYVVNDIPFTAIFPWGFGDSLSFILLFLTVLLLPVISMVIFSVRSGQDILILNSLFICYLVGLAFTASNLLTFYVLFEIILLPMFFVIGLWGSRSERSLAAYMFFLYTLAGSVFFLFALVVIYYFFGHFGFDEIALVSALGLRPGIRKTLWACLFAAFAFKVPLFPVHSWLTVAHVEAPTVGSIILASLLLKLGGYGLARFVVGLFPDCSYRHQDFLISLCLIGGLFSAICAFRQLDLKRFVAYTSISHMHFLVLSLFSLTEVGYWGLVHGMVSHGLVAAGLFALIGCIYDRFGARMTLYFSGLLGQLPVFSAMWCMFLFANAGLPFLSGFPSELCGMLALFLTNPGVGLFSLGSFMFGAVYAFLMQARILFGSTNWWLAANPVASDLLRHEVVLLSYLWVWIIILGIKPEVIISPLRFATI